MIVTCRIKAAAASSTGCVRAINEDQFYLYHVTPDSSLQQKDANACCTSRGTQWYAVFDGMGGEQNGEVASLAAATALARHGDGLRFGNAKKRLLRLTQRLNQAVCQAVGSSGGCTMALALFRGRRLWIAHAGDSRIYWFHARQMTRLTRDHTMDSLFTAKRMRRDAQRSHTLMRYLGMSGSGGGSCEVSCLRWSRGDRVLLCTDGLTDMLSDTQLFGILATAQDVGRAAQQLIQDAVHAGGKDNVTVVLAEVQ